MSINNRAIDGDACSDNPLDFFFFFFFEKPKWLLQPLDIIKKIGPYVKHVLKIDFIERFAKETKKNFAFPLWMVTFEFK